MRTAVWSLKEVFERAQVDLVSGADVAALKTRDQARSPWVVVRRTGLRPLLLLPLRPEEPDKAGQCLVADLEHLPRPKHSLVRDLFCLTEAEAEIACELAQGLSLSDIARSVGVSVNTIRSQLKGIFAKTGTHKQIEVVALMARIAAIGGARRREGVRPKSNTASMKIRKTSLV